MTLHVYVRVCLVGERSSEIHVHVHVHDNAVCLQSFFIYVSSCTCRFSII